MAPSKMLSHEGVSYDVIISGSDFGSQASHLDSIKIGGRECNQNVWIDSTRVQCLGVSPPWDDAKVAVTISGQTHSAAILEAAPLLPSVDAMTSAALNGINGVDGGYLANLTGSGFGFS